MKKKPSTDIERVTDIAEMLRKYLPSTNSYHRRLVLAVCDVIREFPADKEWTEAQKKLVRVVLE